MVCSQFNSVRDTDGPFKLFFDLEEENGQKMVYTDSEVLLSDCTEVCKQRDSFQGCER